MKRTAALLALLAAAGACRRAGPNRDILMTPSHAEEPAASAAPGSAPPESGSVRVAGIAFMPPSSWRRETPSSAMRAAQFAIPGSGNEKAGSLIVYYFGSGQGGGVDENVTRWQGQFSDPSGQPPKSSVIHEEHGAMKVTIVRVDGTYASGMPMGPSTPEPGFSLWGAIVEGPQGHVFLKATGPSAVIARARPDFDSILASLSNVARSM